MSSSSGLLGLADPALPPYVCQFLVAGALQDCAATIFTTPDDDADVIPPDTEFRYGGGQWQVAGGLAEAVSGKSWAELIDEIYVAPCDLDTLGYTNPFTQREIGGDGLNYPSLFDGDVTRLVPTDNPNMEGGAYVTTGDYAKLLLMQLRGGMCGDEQVLSQASLDRMHSDRIGAVYGGETRPGIGLRHGMVGRQGERPAHRPRRLRCRTVARPRGRLRRVPRDRIGRHDRLSPRLPTLRHGRRGGRCGTMTP